MAKKIFITGGAGFLGINLTRFLLNKGCSVISYDFAEEYDYPEANDSRVTVFKGGKNDIRNPEIMEVAMKGSDLVVHCAAALPLYSKEDIFSTDIQGSKNVLQAAEANGIRRVIQISSTAVYGIPDHHPLYENDKLIGGTSNGNNNNNNGNGSTTHSGTSETTHGGTSGSY